MSVLWIRDNPDVPAQTAEIHSDDTQMEIRHSTCPKGMYTEMQGHFKCVNSPNISPTGRWDINQYLVNHTMTKATSYPSECNLIIILVVTTKAFLAQILKETNTTSDHESATKKQTHKNVFDLVPLG